jgi:broad specificity phosphatase PhoE
VPFEAGYASPQRRAVQSARILQRETGVSIKYSKGLKEMRFGEWEGLRFADVAKRWPQLAERWALDPTAVRIPRGETWDSLRKRAKRFLASLGRFSSRSNILIVAHGASLAALVVEILKRPTRDLPRYIQPVGSVRLVSGRRLKWITPC